MIIDLSTISKEMIGKTVPKPVSGTLSGHAAGEPFDKLVYQLIKNHLPAQTYRQFEYLNELYVNNAKHLTHDERATLIESKVLQYLINRGKQTTTLWSTTKPFEEKQDDTADILVTEKGYYQLIDVKTVNTGKKAQAPNIISARKLAKMSKLMIENNDFDSHDIFYFEVQWELQGDQLVCVSSTSKNLFKTDPSKLYINWAAATQIQFHVSALTQDYAGSKEDWAHDYLKNFVRQARNHVKNIERDLITEYEELI